MHVLYQHKREALMSDGDCSRSSDRSGYHIRTSGGASATAGQSETAVEAGEPPADPPSNQSSSIHSHGEDVSRIPLEEHQEAPEEEEVVWLHGDPDVDDDTVDENVTDTSSIAFKQRLKRQRKVELTPKEKIKHNLTVVAAICAGVIVAIVKFIAAAFTGSMAMLSEGIHSLVDAINDSLMLVGQRGSNKPPDLEHPFGYGRAVYFYTFIVSVVILFFGGGFTIFEGVTSLMEGGKELGDPLIAYIVLAIGVAIEGVSLTIALRDVNRHREDMSISEYIRDSKSPTSFTVLLEDTAAVLGMVFAFAGIALSVAFNNPAFDSIASILIGALMASFAIVLVRETTSLLIGEGLTPEDIENVVYIVEEDPAVIKCGRVLSMYMGPNDLVLNLDVTFDDELDEGDILQAIDRLEAELVDDFPECSAIFIEAESLNQVYRQRLDRRLAFEEIEEEEDEKEEHAQGGSGAFHLLRTFTFSGPSLRRQL